MLRVLSVNGQICRPLVCVVVKKMLPPLGHLVKHVILCPEELLPGQIVIMPVHHHLTAAHIVGRCGAQPGEIGTFHRAGNYQGLPLLHMQTHLNEELCVFLELFIFHIHKCTSYI